MRVYDHCTYYDRLDGYSCCSVMVTAYLTSPDIHDTRILSRCSKHMDEDVKGWERHATPDAAMSALIKRHL